MDYYVTIDNLSEKKDIWLKKIDTLNQHKMSLNSIRSALLVIDMQKFFLDEKLPTFTCEGVAVLTNIC